MVDTLYDVGWAVFLVVLVIGLYHHVNNFWDCMTGREEK